MKTQRIFSSPEVNAALKLKGFRVSKNYVPKGEPSAFGRRYFYLILLSIGNSKVHYNNRSFHLDGAYLFFANPRIPYATEILAENQMGYTCVFTESFLKPIERLQSIQESPLFKYSESPAFKLSDLELDKFIEIFETMIDKASTGYIYKDDLMRNYIQLMVHEAMDMRPAEHYSQFNDASLRICSHFMEMLERQFPIEDLSAPLELKQLRIMQTDFLFILTI
ncbi:hypothetical protein J1N10_11470 [Carboxylicivirga sp. A043]|uniref:hypothetical protein n=1 Tax=Carboxylicivirga litoralis TaxID=2816963 RepID=UPI0021CB6AFE|nr:hypothetical protein [Carboxylicivirga sp. A043]MCU4156597.1 hypothetical protein [Carboxylicivirga sp. A043]